MSVYLFYDIDEYVLFFFFFQAEDGIRDVAVTGVQTCALPIYQREGLRSAKDRGSRGGSKYGEANRTGRPGRVRRELDIDGLLVDLALAGEINGAVETAHGYNFKRSAH